jgi:uncharacterized protein (DUF1810 family)
MMASVLLDLPSLCQIVILQMNRFLEAQEKNYATALSEIRHGRKETHWMWYIFPQIQGLGHSVPSQYYAIKDLKEATTFLHHPLLGSRLIRISKAVLDLPGNDPTKIFGSPDDLKLRSSMTLFSLVKDADPVFRRVLDKYFKGAKDPKTMKLL